LRSSPTLVLLACELAAARADFKASRRERLPWLTHTQASFQQEEGLADDEAWSVQAAISIPLFSLAQPGESAVLAADTKQLGIELRIESAQIVTQVREAYGALLLSHRSWLAFEATATPILKELRGARADMQQPRLDVLQQIDTRIITVERAACESRYKVYCAFTRFEQVVGTSPVL